MSAVWFKRFFCVLINPPYWYAPICPPPRERQRSVINDYSLEWIVHPVRSSSFRLLSVWHNSTSLRLFLNVLSKNHKRSTVFPSRRKIQNWSISLLRGTTRQPPITLNNLSINSRRN